MLRGALLLAVAVVIGVVLLNRFDTSSDPFSRPVVAAKQTTTTTSKAPAVTTTTPQAAPTSARAVSSVKVLPANGTSVQGAGARAALFLKAAGYNVLSAVDATVKAVSTTAVYASAGYEVDAREVAAKLGLPATVVRTGTAPVATKDLRGANVVVVIGNDVANRATTTTSKP
jgi:hypothetical protein